MLIKKYLKYILYVLLALITFIVTYTIFIVGDNDRGASSTKVQAGNPLNPGDTSYHAWPTGHYHGYYGDGDDDDGSSPETTYSGYGY